MNDRYIVEKKYITTEARRALRKKYLFPDREMTIREK